MDKQTKIDKFFLGKLESKFNWKIGGANSKMQGQNLNMYYNKKLIIMMKDQQVRKNCQAFINKLQNTNVYDTVREFLLNWNRQDDKQTVPVVIDAFVKISKVIYSTNQDKKDDKLIECFNRCLVKEAIVPKKAITADSVEAIASQNPQASKIIDNVHQWIKKDNKPVQKPPIKPVTVTEEIKESALMNRLESQPKFRQIIKIIQLYLKSIITFDEVRNLLLPIYHSDPSLFAFLVQTSEQIIQKRRKATIFSSLNELVDKKYPIQRVGESYILIPQGYANYSKAWKNNELEYIMNRKCVSVPLGSQVSFIINKKTDYEQQLFSYQDQRYEIDNTICSLRSIIKILSSNTINPRKLQSPLLQRVINQLYPNQNVGSIFIRHPQLAKNLLLPRVIQKKDQLIACRDKFIKICQDVAAKNFYKSLDYRCYYFAKNDKKFNCPLRWEKEIQMRKKQILENRDYGEQEQIQDRESLQRGRFFYINSFDNITKQNLIENKEVRNIYDRKQGSSYPKYPDNQILFILNFADEQILNDVLQILLYYCNRKNLLQLLIFKIMRTDIKRRLKKSTLINYLIQNKQKIVNNSQIIQILNNVQSAQSNANMEGIPANEQSLLNQIKLSKNFKDSQEQFMHMIQEEQQPTILKQQENPFQGPQKGYTFIGTKQVYLLLRYITAIYQRFIKAKQYSQQFSSTILNSSQGTQQPRVKLDIYKFFLTVIYKIKQRKYFEENLRKIFCKNAFIFFTLQKLITNAVKIINNVSIDSLTFQIIKDQTKDYEMGAFDWQKFCFPNITMQLTRLYLEKQTLFRFTYEPEQHNVYISAWNPPFKQIFSICEHNEELAHLVEEYTVKVQKSKHTGRNRKHNVDQLYDGQEITMEQAGKLMFRGEYVLVNKDKDKEGKDKEGKHHHSHQNKYVKMDIVKMKKMRKYL